MAFGSAAWGEIARLGGVPLAHYISSTGLLCAVPIVRRWKLQTGAGMDLTPSMHWPAPVAAHQIEAEDLQVLVTVEYRIDPKDRQGFLIALDRLALERRRDGAYAWGVFEDSAQAGRFLETFVSESWIEHLRQHERVTKADRLLEDLVYRFTLEKPKVTHLIAAEPEPNTFKSSGGREMR
jgi:hypothetical protein